MGSIGENPFKQMIVAQLVKNTVSCDLLKVEKEYYNISSILLNEKGERTVVHYRTSHSHLAASLQKMRAIAKTKMVYMGNLPGAPLHERVALLAHFKKEGACTTLNLGIRDCRESLESLQQLFASADILILNTHEYAEVIKVEYSSLDFHKNQADRIGFGNKILVVTDGEKGSWGYMNNQTFYQKAIAPQKIIDTTGAGDGYTSGFIASYLRTHNFQTALSQGAQYAAVILAKIGAQ
jgi:sugar/nucleoside kinase (ribokinase family)